MDSAVQFGVVALSNGYYILKLSMAKESTLTSASVS